MAVTVQWSDAVDETVEATWDTAEKWSVGDSNRSPYILLDKDGNPVVLIPDFNVRWVGTPPDPK